MSYQPSKHTGGNSHAALPLPYLSWWNQEFCSLPENPEGECPAMNLTSGPVAEPENFHMRGQAGAAAHSGLAKNWSAPGLLQSTTSVFSK